MVTQRAQRRVQNRYELLEPLGRGGMGVVWLAEDEVLQRKVAVKQVEIPPGVPANEIESMRARVMREARAAARLNHPNVTTIFDVVNDGDTTWIVMEYVAAPTVTEIVSQEGPMSVQRTVAVGLGVLSALEAAHAAGIIHRDVKPGNVMVPPPNKGNVKLADFGVAAVQGDPKITMTGLIIGSPSYMAPEQAQEGVSSAASDMWGLGTTLYFAVEGRPAFDKGAAIPTLTAVSYEPPAPMERAGALAPILERLLEKKPEERPTAGELRALLEEIAADDDPWAPAAAVAPQTIVLDDEPTAVAAPTAVVASTAVVQHVAEADDEGWDVEPEQRYERRRSAWPWIIAAMVLLSIAGLTLPSLLDDDTQVAGTAAEDEPAAEEPAEGNSRGREEEAAAGSDGEAGDTGGAAADSGGATAVEEEPVDQAEPPAEDSAADDSSTDTQSSGADPGVSDSGVTVPADWSRFSVADTGTEVAHPSDWTTQSRSASATDINDPNGGRYLRVDFTETPGDDAVADWERQSDAFGQRHSNYREVAIDEYDYPGAETAALWEYTYDSNGAQLHAYNLAIVIGGRGYALNFQTRESQWAESQKLWEQFVKGFEPAQ